MSPNISKQVETFQKKVAGGDLVSMKFNENKDSIIKFVSLLSCSDIYYCNSKTGRKYLLAELNIAKFRFVAKPQSTIADTTPAMIRMGLPGQNLWM